jgi:predicted AAA+ superfamily ATPase
MLAHVNGQTVNYSTLAKSLEVSSATVKNYIDLLESAYMVEVVPPYISTMGNDWSKPRRYISLIPVLAACGVLRI